MIVWSGDAPGGVTKTGGVYDPAADTWSPTSTLGPPEGRRTHTAVWTGTSMIVWSGGNGFAPAVNTGGSYDPVTDAWEPTSTVDAPSGRYWHTAVWTGTKMIIWGGNDPSPGEWTNTGGLYDPATDSWTPTSTVAAPSPRQAHSAVWTGTKMIVWGGWTSTGGTDTGGIYDPATDSWTPMSTVGAPAPRAAHSAVWTGTKMIVWSGNSNPDWPHDSVNTGGIYDPDTDTWTPIGTLGAPSARYYHSAVWTGTQMIVWGGFEADLGSTATGGIYDPAAESWMPTSMLGAPSPRWGHTAVWTGDSMVVWAGEENPPANGGARTSTGAIYDPATDSWTPTTMVDVPCARFWHTAVWTGTEMIVWSGDALDGVTNSGGVYTPPRLLPAALVVDPTGDAVLETGETVDILPAWHNVSGETQTLGGNAIGFDGPTGRVSYVIEDPSADYGTVGDQALAPCTDCYRLGILADERPAVHWDATFTELLTPDTGLTQSWRLHVGESFQDVPRLSPYYGFVETLLHRGVTTGCGGANYCPAASMTRQQMAVFVLVGKEGTDYAPPECTQSTFADVPVTSGFCRWVTALARRGVTAGCGGGSYCPTSPVTRGQMAVFLLKTLDPGLVPPVCGTPTFADVPATSPYCAYIEELARRAVVGGCGGGNYCPTKPVTRGQMAVFIGAAFGLTLYGP